MKRRLYLSVASMLVVVISKAQPIPNAGFENWTNFGAYSDPVSWSTHNSMSTGNYTCEKGTPGAVGASYMKLTVKNTGSINMGVAASSPNLWGGPGFACNARPANLTGKWQYLVSPNDTSFIQVFFYKWNAANMVSDPVGTGSVFLMAGSVTTWTNFSVPIVYMNGDMPDSALIVVTAGAANIPIINDYLYLDDLAFTGNVAGINEPSHQLGFHITPNPFSSRTTISFDEEQVNASVSIFDMLGKRVKTIQFTGKQLMIEKGEMQEGIYFVQIMDEKKNLTNAKIVIR